MTIPLAVVGLTYAGEDVQLEDLTIFLEIYRGLNESPGVRGKDTTVPARAGTIAGNRINHIVKIELRGQVTADPTETELAAARASYRTNQRTMRALFATNRARADLVALLEDGSTATISALPIEGAIWNEVVVAEQASVSIPLDGYDDWVIEAAP